MVPSNSLQHSDAQQPSPSAASDRDSGTRLAACLAITAAILLVGWSLQLSRPAPAWADGMTVSGGDYTVVVGGVNARDEDYVYVLDAIAQKMVVYRFDAMKQQIEIVTGVDLAKVREESSAKTPAKLPPKSP